MEEEGREGYRPLLLSRRRPKEGNFFGTKQNLKEPRIALLAEFRGRDRGRFAVCPRRWQRSQSFAVDMSSRHPPEVH